MAETPDRRNCRWEATHRRIFTTALDLFEEFGYEQISVSDIAAEAQVSVPTFYAHYPSKDHLIMALPTPEEVGAMLAPHPVDLPVGERIRRTAAQVVSTMPPDAYAEMALRWKIIAASPVLRNRVGEYERATAEMILRHLATPPGTREAVQASAYLAAYTVGLLTWADSKGERKLEDTMEEAFDALSD